MSNKYMILLVDDDDFYLQLFREKLTKEGFAVIASDDGIDAYEKYFRHSPDMVITDIYMKSNGIDLLTKIKDHNPEIPVITISGGVGNDDGKAMLELATAVGADHHFRKPDEVDNLIQVVNKYFN